MAVDRYSVGEFETVFKFVADSGLWGANVRAILGLVVIRLFVSDWWGRGV